MMVDIAALTGTILHLQRLSTEDGPGLRTTVFFKGCPLHCKWCHNPESILSTPQVQWIAARCIGCDSCIEACPHGALVHANEGILRDRQRCEGCGSCVEACPTGAMEILGMPATVDELVEELCKDRAYFDKSGGGVTFSGGEPTLQANFTLELARRLKNKAINLALDTCALCKPSTLEAFLPWFDIFLVDLKLIDPVEHQKWTGAPLDQILANLDWLAAEIRSQGHEKTLWIRTPLIPGATFSRENLSGISAFLKNHLSDVVDRWELCAFNNLCRDKYSRLDMDWQFAQTPLMSPAELEQAGTWALSGGFDPSRTFVTGAAKTDD